MVPNPGARRRLGFVRRGIGSAVLAAVALGVAHLAAVDARAATIAVTTRRDVVADDGLCSLREAVDSANRQRSSGRAPGECVAGSPLPTIDVIQLRRGSYKLTLGGPGDDDNAGGDLDVTESVVFEGLGRAKTLVKNAVGSPLVRGDGDRLVHVDPAGKGGVDVTFRRLALVKGDVACTGAGCGTGASAVEARGDGALAFEGCRVVGNSATCFEQGCGDSAGGAAIRAAGGGALSVDKTIVKRNVADCQEPACRLGASGIRMTSASGPAVADFALQGSLVAVNGATCFADGCRAGGVVDVEARNVVVRDARVVGSEVGCLGRECGSASVVRLLATGEAEAEGLVLEENDAGCTGDLCEAPSVLEGRSQGIFALVGMVALDNHSSCSHLSCRVNEQIRVATAADDVYVERLELRLSSTSCNGEECVTTDVIELAAPPRSGVVVLDSTFDELLNQCFGESCGVEDVVSLRGDRLDVERTAVTDNMVACQGDSCRGEHVIDIAMGGDVAMTDVNVAQNVARCIANDCRRLGILSARSTDASVTATRVAITANTAFCHGDGCELIPNALVAEKSLGLGGVAVRDNVARCEGFLCDVAPMLLLSAADQASVRGSAFERNVSACEGRTCATDSIVDLRATFASIANGSFAANRSECTGTGCNVGLGGALRTGGGTITVDASSFVDNRTDGFGAGIFNQPSGTLVLRGVTLRGNQAGLRRTIELGGAGGAIYNDAASGSRGRLHVFDSSIRDNSAVLGGGGIANEGTIEAVVRTAFQSNVPGNCASFAGGTGCP